MKKITFLTAILLAFAGTISAQSMFHAQKASLRLETPGEAVASWEDNSHDFGEISQGIPVSHTFTFENTGTKALNIEQVKVGCGCTATEYSKGSIAPGETGFVTATYKAAKVGHFTKTVTVFTNTEATQQRLVLKGEVLVAER